MLEKIKQHKLILILLVFILFLLIDTKVNATISSDLSTLTEAQKETIAKTWQAAVSYCESQGIDVEKSNYCVTYSNGSSSFCSVFILNPSKNTLFELGTTNGSKNWFNYGIYFDCQVGGNPVNRWGGYNNSTTIATYYFNGDTSFIIANNVKTSNNSYKQISRSIEDVDFIDNPFNKPILLPEISIEYNENTSSYWVWTDWYDIREIGALCDFYAYGQYTDIDVNDPDECWQWELLREEYKENEEGKTTIVREGFELWRYGYYSYCLWNLDTGDWVIKGIDFTEESLKGTEAEGCLDPFNNLNLYLDNTTNPPIVYSNFIEKDLLDKCNLVDFSVSFDNGESFSSVYIDCKEERVAEDTTYTRFYYKLFSNDTYTFKLRIFDENYNAYEVVKTFTINSYEEIIDINGSDTISASPFITAYADSNIIKFNTQTFKERISLKYFEDTTADTLRYTAYYIDEDAYQLFGDNYEDWILMDVGYEEYDKVIKGYPYYFKTEFSFDNLEDGDKFYFVFYDNKLGCFSQVTTYTLESKQDLYTVSQNITFNNDKFQRLFDFFNEHFGFLNYPLEFIINLLTRILNINYEEPILHIPTLYVPGTANKIFNGFDYNFNSLLENKAILNIYNIYLVAVDFCIVIAFVIHAKNTAEEVLGKNG